MYASRGRPAGQVMQEHPVSGVLSLAFQTGGNARKGPETPFGGPRGPSGWSNSTGSQLALSCEEPGSEGRIGQ